MKNVHRAWVATTTAAVITAAGAGPVFAGPVTAAAVGHSGLQERLDDMVASGAVGALAEVRDEHGVWRATSGVAQLGTTQPVPARGQFRIGSITKTFVATVVLQLVNERRIRLEDTVEAWLPGVVPDGEHITIKQLLNHTSGIPDYVQTLTLPPNPEFLDNRYRTWTAEELVQRAVTGAPATSGYAYSNTNYLLLGEIIEKATGRTYSKEIERRIIKPLRLRDTVSPGTSPRIPKPHPHGYVPIVENGEMRLVDYTTMNPSLMGASGDMISSTSDLHRFFAALLGGRLLPENLFQAMSTPAVEGKRYGLGLEWIDTTCDVRVYGNDGDALTYQSWSFSTRDGRRQVSVTFTPNFRADLDDAAEAFVDEAICG